SRKHRNCMIRERRSGMRINDIRLGTLGGTVCSIWASSSLGDLGQTILTAALGTLVSFGVGRLLAKWSRRG
ncbi:MAG: hypothetical protein ACN6ON_00225, partial [Sphingobacterium sp.]